MNFSAQQLKAHVTIQPEFMSKMQLVGVGQLRVSLARCQVKGAQRCATHKLCYITHPNRSLTEVLSWPATTD